MKRVAIIGDVHACIDEFRKLYLHLQFHDLDEIRHAGDLVDRGPDSGACVQFAREQRINGVLGNHEDSLLRRFDQGAKKKTNEDKEKTFSSIRSAADWRYLRALPSVHVDDELKAVYVHAGVWPKLDLCRTPPECFQNVQLVHPYRKVGESKWFGVDRNGESEEELRKEGWVRWYEICDHPYTIVYGHSVFPSPMVYGNTIGIDTGCVYGGDLTAVILPEREFVSVKAKKVYWPRTQRVAHVGFK